MVRVATELRETLLSLLQVEPSDSPVLRRIIDSYRDIARELGQQDDVELALRDILPPTRATRSLSHSASAVARHSVRRISPSHTSRKSPSV